VATAEHPKTSSVETTRPGAGAPAPESNEPARYKFTVDDYYKMAEVGILHEDSRVELIDGDIIMMSPIGRRHASRLTRLATFFFSKLGDRAVIWVQNPLSIDASSQLQPDIAVLKPRADFYLSALPVPADVLLLVEVMDSSASYDRGVKLPLYATSKISEVWLVDLNAERIETFRRPVGEVYTENGTSPRGLSLAPEAFPDAVLQVNDILG
jgi:Uma2 family endonuclease